jgi:hypothetical protein
MGTLHHIPCPDPALLPLSPDHRAMLDAWKLVPPAPTTAERLDAIEAKLDTLLEQRRKTEDARDYARLTAEFDRKMGRRA